MTVSPTVTANRTTLRPVPKPSSATRPRRTFEVLQGTHAHMTVEIQGNTWIARGAVRDIEHHVETGEAIDQRGDAMFDQHRDHLRRALRLARIEGAPQTAALLVELIASADMIAELDESEDFHRRAIRPRASDADRALMVANAVCSALLGQSEAQMPWPLDGGAGESDDDGCLFVAVETMQP